MQRGYVDVRGDRVPIVHLLILCIMNEFMLEHQTNTGASLMFRSLSGSISSTLLIQQCEGCGMIGLD